MRKIQKILIGTFLGGVLLGGIGTGIAVVEYSSISYAGERRLGEESMVTENFDYSFSPDVGKVEVERQWNWNRYYSMIEEDESVPVNTVRYQVTYNQKTVRPRVGSYDGRIWLEADYQNSDFALWMENKDVILADLKQGRIASYGVDYITGVKIMVNPETSGYIELAE